MDFNKLTSLTGLATVSVIASTWYQERSLTLMQDPSTSTASVQFMEISENNVLRNLKALLVPTSVKDNFFNMYQPMGLEICNWIDDHRFLDFTEKRTSEVLCWNMLGVIDRKRTAEKILVNATANESNFRLACMYSLKNVISDMWPKLPSCCDIPVSQINSIGLILVLFWTCHFRNSINELMKEMDYIGYKDPIHFAFWLSISTNNEIAAKFFLTELPTEEERQRLVERTAKRLCDSDNQYNHSMLPFLLLHLEPTQQEELLHSYPQPILLQFLKWPNQHYFKDIFNKTKSYLTPRSYFRILHDIAYYAYEFDRSQIYKDLFEDFWQNGSMDCHGYVHHMSIEGNFLSRLCLSKYSNYVMETIIQSFTLDQKQQLLISFNTIQFCASLMKKQRWDIVKFLFTECIPLEDRAVWIDKIIELYTAYLGGNFFISTTSTERDALFSIIKATCD